ncbi:hypothetical protein GGR34_003310 [Microvirga flocculans]|uniref:DUF6602 domain-containing protein n=1 Tax=Microvirga flocculans TaxID=217168 RepID=A0A7W6IHL3_9HYPH|nr:DUF6602 domain-containing protein [Microvirga flocculans]MBB4041632.1 hypothetical protein [Microvirga flocculans]
MTWSLERLLSDLHDDIQQRLARVRGSIGHSPSKGAASEAVWLELLQTYLPERYRADTAFVVDSEGAFSEQIDVVVYDRQYSPFIFKFEGQKVIPAESVYAVFEAKQSVNAAQVGYAQDKAASVRRLHRTSLPIPHAGGVYPPKPLPHILAGLLTLESDWKPAFGQPLADALDGVDAAGRLDLGCVAAHGHYAFDASARYSFVPEGRPATAFLFELIARLQASATVPMVDIRAYARWLTGKPT